MTCFPTVYIVQSIGVREGLDLRICRDKDGRLHRQVKILRNKGDAASQGKPRWVDAALIFKTEEQAKSALIWAKTHRERHRSIQTLTNVLIGVDYIASLALSSEVPA